MPSGAPTTIDSTGALTGEFVSDGGAVVYRTPTGLLRRAATSAPSPETLVDAGVTGLVGLSPDETKMLYYTNFVSDSNGDALFDLSIASTTAPGATAQVESSPTVTFLGDDFTADSNYVLYSTSSLSDVSSGTLEASPVAGGASIQLGLAVIEETATSGSKVVFADNYSSTSNTADIEGVDLVAPKAATTLAANTTPGYFITLDGASIAYTTLFDVAGLYLVPVP